MQWVTTLITSIESQFKFASRQNSWNIHHRLLRSHNPPPTKTYDDDDGPSTEPPPPPPTSYQHLLHVSYLSQQRTWCYIHTPPPEQPSNHGPANPDAIISIPQPQIESHFQLLVNTWAPLWQFRSILNIPQGHTFSAGQFTIRFGDIRSARQGTQAAIIPSPGVVVCITTTIGAPENDGSSHNVGRDDSLNGGEAAQDEELDFEEARDVIRALWRSLKTGRDFGKSEPREVFMGKDGFEGKGNLEKQYEAHVRMWCEIMRMRG
ncbi:hypothetical protein BS50DRAFT_566780 [Corynespora cassiicola Philippines]|uniref:Mediator of RNA polymerase II transcription subunit 20 n=1 Tax=Corynespora cassiicola Philippines TaxID=1448308 RepID=A0A2T2P875_CORCC|nr:hypothetical protein BS50DRAFT_566780 [Corynespora cassiicola Philippines]